MKHRDPEHPYVSRGGIKLRHALDAFAMDVTGLRAADLGCSTGGFTDCLLQAGAAHVTAIDTAYGQFAWKLRNDPRVRLLERTNALHAAPASDTERVELVVIDLGWTPQRLCLPAARRWLASEASRVVTLIKPHYELEGAEKSLLERGVLAVEEAERVTQRVLESVPSLGFRVVAATASPIAGSKENKLGNTEWLALLQPTP